LRALIDIYYEQRGWSAEGIPTVATLERLGLWEFLGEETKEKIIELT